MGSGPSDRTIYRCKLAQSTSDTKTLIVFVAKPFDKGPMSSVLLVEGVRFNSSHEYDDSGLTFVGPLRSGRWQTISTDWNILKKRRGVLDNQQHA